MSFVAVERAGDPDTAAEAARAAQRPARAAGAARAPGTCSCSRWRS